MRRIPAATLAAHLAAVLALSLSGPAVAQSGIHVGGQVATTFGVAFDGTIPVASAQLELRASGDVGGGVFPDASFEAELIGSYDGAGTGTDVHLGKAYATVYLGDTDLVVGQQIAFWGSTDAVNPEDVINPRDLSFPAADPADERIPIPMVRAIIHDGKDGLKLDLVLVPVFRVSKVPGPAWQTTSPATLQLPPGVTVVGQADTADNLPAAKLANVQFGARMTLDLDILNGGDVSVAYFHGIRTTPTASATLLPTATPGQVLVQPVLDYDRYDLLGADFSLATAQAVFRGEAAYTFTHDPNGTDPTIGNPGFQAVLEAEHTFPSGAVATLEGILEHTNGDQGRDNAATAFSSLATIQYDATARLTAQAAWLHDYSDGSGMLRPSLSYTFADGVTGNAELFVFYGRDGSRYGDWRDNSQLRVGLTYAF
ncbi:MAG TPA: DUF1302 family protein [Trueperaceae bacterium]|nr:DUF1302 family protein [Trueperaceae bacterium]